MYPFVKHIEVRWADLDPNLHVRHSVYYDYCASSRISFLHHQGITAEFMQSHSFGPVLFREECIFRKEIRLSDNVRVDLKLKKARNDYSRWTILHNIFVDGDALSAIVTIDGAWIDIIKRKLLLPPVEVCEAFNKMPREEQFEWST